MRYGDLIQFEPIESVVQLRDANRESAARQLVATYVVSDEMAERLAAVVIPQMQFDEPADNKGLLIVGNYGTGKSHLMSVLSAVAERADLADILGNAAVAEAACRIAGKFKVARTELGSTTMDFREFLCSQIEEALASWDVAYRFPPRNKIPNHKRAFEDMMAAFHERFPDQGLLLVVDELLDYLKSRKDQELVLDLNFLREIGEVSKDLRFRFMAGVQEAIFDSLRFSHVADSLRRVKDRFEQLLIARKDVKFVVAERLLKKTGEQQTRTRDYLTPFTKFYGSMNERLDEFVRLFPVHPDFINTFERITVIEKREVLKALSLAMKRIIDHELPTDSPGLIAYDAYWTTLRENPILPCRARHQGGDRLQPGAGGAHQAGVHPPGLQIGCAADHPRAVGPPPDPPGHPRAARRHSGRTPRRPVSLPAGNRGPRRRAGRRPAHAGRDRPARDPADRQRPVHLRQPDNRQHYLDLKKTDDYDALIEKRAETLDDTQLDRYYYEALKRVAGVHRHDLRHRLQASGSTSWSGASVTHRGRATSSSGHPTSGPRRSRRATSTCTSSSRTIRRATRTRRSRTRCSFASPARTTPCGTRSRAAPRRSIWHRARQGHAKEAFTKPERRASYRDLDEVAAGARMTTAFEVSYRRPDEAADRDGSRASSPATGARANVSEMVNTVASVALAAHFENEAPEYPTFADHTSHKPRAGRRRCRTPLRWIAGSSKTQQAAKVLDALELLDGDRLDPSRSKYAKHILDLLGKKGQGHVLNRAEFIHTVQDVEYMATGTFRLEPDWVVVCLVSLIYSGDLVLAIPGNKFDATDVAILATTSVDDLANLRHVERPKEWNIPALKAVFELLGLTPGMAQLVAQGKDEPVHELQKAVENRVKKLVMAQQALQAGFHLWGRSLLDESAAKGLQSKLDGTKGFLESLQAFSSPGKLKNFRQSKGDVEQQKAGLDALQEVETLQDLVADLGTTASYLSTAEAVLPSNHEWVDGMKKLRVEVLTQVCDPAKRSAAGFRQQAEKRLGELKKEYSRAYLDLHTRARLGANDDKRKSRLTQDNQLRKLKGLATIDLMPRQHLADFQNRLAGLKSCFALTEQDLDAAAECPHCGFRPAVEAATAPADQMLSGLDDELDTLLLGWTETLLANLGDPTTKEQLGLLKPEPRQLVDAFIAARTLPDDLDHDFVHAVKEVLSGLAKVVVSTGDLRAALLSGGSPATLGEMKKRFDEYLDDKAKGKDPNKVRIVLE